MCETSVWNSYSILWDGVYSKNFFFKWKELNLDYIYRILLTMKTA